MRCGFRNISNGVISCFGAVTLAMFVENDNLEWLLRMVAWCVNIKVARIPSKVAMSS